jgi:cell division transport system permease protein
MKHTFIQLERIFKSGGRGFLRNAWLSTAGTMVMTVTLLVLVMTFVANSVLNSAILSVTNKIDVSVYLADNISQDQLAKLITDIEQQSNVKTVQYVSKQDALNDFRDQNKANPALLQGINEVGTDAVSASLKIKAKDPTHLDSIVNYLQKPDIKKLQSEDANASANRKTAIDRIVQVARFLRIIGLIGGVIFAVISVMVIFNTIRMAIFNRKDEIEIMQLVGASNWYIRGPFLIEAGIYGVVAGVITLILSYVIVINELPKLNSYTDVGSTVDLFRHNLILIGIGLVVFGILLGALSSLLAMRRYLKLKTSK